MNRFFVGMILVLANVSLAAPAPAPAPDLQSQVQAQVQKEGCKVWDDSQGIPHVFGASDVSAFACMGYLHARDRLWEMDFFRRTVQGRKSEVLGSDNLESDFTLRLLGLYERAKPIFDGLSDTTKKIYIAYAIGVNRGRAEALKRGVYEFNQLGYQPEPWTPQDSIAILLLQSLSETQESLDQQLTEVDRAKAYGPDALKYFIPDGLPWDIPILNLSQQTVKVQSSIPALARRNDLTRNPENKLFNRVFGNTGRGSNNWVIGPSRSVSGRAMVANDPHLTLSHPPYWHLSHVGTSEWDVMGAALPGSPVVASGNNRHVAWGLTDAFLIASYAAYVPEADLKNAVTTRPLIWIKYGPIKVPFALKTFRRTKSGLPVLPLTSPDGTALILNWSGFHLTSADFEHILGLRKAATAQEIDVAIAAVGLPSWNFVFADAKGNIGYRACGKVFRATKALSFGIPTMSLNQFETDPEFSTFLTPAEMPHVMNPSDEYVVTANNRQWAPGYKFSAGRASSPGFRAYRIDEMINATPKHNFSTMARMQCDVSVTDAKFLLPKMIARLPLDPVTVKPFERALAAEFAKWNYEADLTCKMCAPYRRWIENIFDGYLLDESSLYRRLQAPIDLDIGQILMKTYRQMIKDLQLNDISELPTWAMIHRNSFPHLSEKEQFESSSIAVPGDTHTVNVAEVNWQDGHFEQDTGASERLIVELTEPPTVYSVLAGPNVDIEKPDPSAAGGPWEKWQGCGYERRSFPVNWSGVPTTAIQF